MNNRDEETLDPHLREYLKMLRPVPRRDPLAAVRAKAKFLAEIEVLFEPSLPAKSTLPTYSGIFGFFKTVIKRTPGSLNSLPRTALSFSSILLIVAILLFGWVGITAQAAESALPGDTLYSFKTSLEQVQLALSGDLDKQAGLYLEFASHRLQEIEMLVDARRYQKAAALSTRFQLNIQKAIDITNDLAKVNPARAAQRRSEINSKLASFAAQLNELMGKLPPAYQPEFNNVFPPVSFGTPVAPTPGITQTSTPAMEQGTRRIEPSSTPIVPKDASDPCPNNGGDTCSDKEQDSGKSPESSSGNGGQEKAGGNYEVINPGNNKETTPGDYPEYNPGYNLGSDNQGSGAEHNNEQVNLDNNRPEGSNFSSPKGQNSGDHENIPPESSFTNPPPAISQ